MHISQFVGFSKELSFATEIREHRLGTLAKKEKKSYQDKWLICTKLIKSIEMRSFFNGFIILMAVFRTFNCFFFILYCVAAWLATASHYSFGHWTSKTIQVSKKVVRDITPLSTRKIMVGIGFSAVWVILFSILWWLNCDYRLESDIEITVIKTIHPLYTCPSSWSLQVKLCILLATIWLLDNKKLFFLFQFPVPKTNPPAQKTRLSKEGTELLPRIRLLK